MCQISLDASLYGDLEVHLMGFPSRYCSSIKTFAAQYFTDLSPRKPVIFATDVREFRNSFSRPFYQINDTVSSCVLGEKVYCTKKRQRCTAAKNL